MKYVFSLLWKSVSVSVESQSDDGRLFHSFAVQALANPHEWKSAGGGDWYLL